jgi:hypothetical protein
MRLTSAQITTIESTAKALLGEGAKVWLYGSRLDDQAAGGDIDLLLRLLSSCFQPETSMTTARS